MNNLRNLCFIITFMTAVTTWAQQQDNDSSGLNNEDLAADLLSIEAVAHLPAGKQKAVFDRLQGLVSSLLEKPSDKLELLNALCAKQVALFPTEKKVFIDYATFYLSTNDNKNMFEMAKQSLSKINFFYQEKDNLLTTTAYTIIGKYYLEDKQPDKAYENLAEARDLASRLVLTYLLLGNSCFQLKKYDECVSSYYIAFSTLPEQAQPIDYFFYGVALHKTNHTDKAKEILELGCSRYPNAEGLHLNLGYILRQMDKLIEAYFEFHMEKILFGWESTFYKTAEYNIRMTEEFIGLQGNERAKNILKHLKEWDTLLSREDFDKAIEKIKIVRDEFGASHWVLDLFLEQTYRQAGKYNEAISVLNTMQLAYPGIANTFIEKSQIYMALDDKENALTALKLAHQLSPENYKVQNILDKIKAAIVKKKDNILKDNE